MRIRITLLLTIIFSCQIIFGQVPDFTVTDIYGETHSLYEDYLDKGKAVILDFSTTWCSPCWYWVHQSKALENIYKTLGPAGSDEVMVLFIEADQATTIDNLYGETDNSYGNWIEGTTYPFIETPGWEIADDYGIIGYPTVYLICPDGNIQTSLYGSSGPFTVPRITEEIYECIENSGLDNDARIVHIDEDRMACDLMNATVHLNNYGNNPIDEMEITVYRNDELYKTASWSGSILPNKVGEITVEDLEVDLFDDETEFKFVLQNDENNSNNEFTYTAKQVKKSGLKLDLFVDIYNWQDTDNLITFYNELDEEIKQVSATNGEESNIEVELPEGCYRIEVDLESAGSLIISDSETNNIVLNKPNSPFVNSIDKKFFVELAEVTNITHLESEINQLRVSPNPMNDVSVFSFETIKGSNAHIYVTNTLGENVKTLFKGSLQKGYHEYQIDLGSLPSALYIVHLETLNGKIETKLIKN